MFWLALNMGILGSLHCIGMCGPLSLMHIAGKKNSSNFSLYTHALSYQMGRSLSYAMLGLIFGLVGSAFAWVGLQKVISVSLGIALILLAIFSSARLAKIESLGVFKTWNRWLMGLMQKYGGQWGNKNSWIAGSINGLVPCGLVYFALASSMATENALEGAIFMWIFGMGTLPAMAAFTILGNRLRNKIKLSYQYILPVLAICSGVILIWRGLEINVPENLSLLLSMKDPEMCH